jgi:hypothetical protein
LIEHTDLVTQRADVGETAESIRYDDPRAEGELLILGVCCKVAIGDEFILKTIELASFHPVEGEDINLP